jgi:hypothetical protein
MDIKEFIKQTIIGISEAVIEINDEKKETGLIVCPASAKGGNINFVRDFNGTIVMNVDFNLCVEVEDNTSAEVGLKISIVKAGVDNNIKNSTMSNIKFTLPVAFPSANYKIGRPKE